MTQTHPDITLLVIIGIAVMLLLVVSFLVVFTVNQRKRFKYQQEMQELREKQQNQLIESAILSEEGERHRISETLHDEVGAILSSVRLHLSNIKTDQLDEKSRQLHEKSKQLLDEGIDKVRSISHNLHSTLLKEFGLNEAIRHFLNKTVQSRLINIETHLDNNYFVRNSQSDLAIYRIVQELVNNILKHTHASYIHIKSALNEQLLVFILNFDSNGLSQEQFEELRYKPEGLGLKNIQNRIILLKGKIFFEKNETGNVITLTIPVNDQS